jgi:hypothetical protein
VVATFTSSSGLSTADFAVDPVAEGFTFGGTPSVEFDPVGNQLRVTFAPTPAPASVCGILAGVLVAGRCLAGRRRKWQGR